MIKRSGGVETSFIWFMIASAVLLSGCGGGGGSRSDVAGLDTTPPTVESTSPLKGAIQVAQNAIISATFSEELKETPTTSTFIVNAVTGSGGVVSGTIDYFDSTRTATFHPSTLAAETIYSVTITTGVQDKSGNPMAAPYSWSFTTGTGIDNSPPSFAANDPQLIASPTSSNSISLSWSAATDNSTPQNELRYQICQSTVPTDCTAVPFPLEGGNIVIYETLAGATSFSLPQPSPKPVLTSSTTYYFVVRAKDLVGLMDTNTAQKSARTFGAFASLGGSQNANCSGEGTFTKSCGNSATNPSVAMVGSTLYLTWTETGKIYFRTLNTASKVWSSAVRIDPTTPAATIQQQSRVVSNGATTPVPYVTYTECDPACKVWVKKWNAAAWEAVGGSLNVDPTRSAQDSAIVFDGRNPPVPYVIWTEADASGVMQIFVKRFDAASSSWILVGGGSLTVNPVVLNVGGQNPSIAIGGFTIKAAWAECTSADCELYVKRLEADTWLPASPTSLKVGHLSVAPKPNDPSLAFINDGLNNTLYLAWHENIAFYVKKENPDGSFTSVGTIPDSPSSSSGISFGGTASAAQVPYIVFADSTNPATKIFVNRWNGTGWVTEGNGALNMTHGGSQPSTVDSSIAFLQGTPYVAWSERGACIVPLTSPPGSPFTVCGQNNSSSYQIYVKRLE